GQIKAFVVGEPALGDHALLGLLVIDLPRPAGRHGAAAAVCREGSAEPQRRDKEGGGEDGGDMRAHWLLLRMKLRMWHQRRRRLRSSHTWIAVPPGGDLAT